MNPSGTHGDALDEYRAKRKFDRTPEPSGDRIQASRGGVSRFVVQKHDARRLHYDFRLEAAGVLVSWAVPKGPSYDPRVKRLAVHVEDHPLDYEDFEGVIPDAQYGAGAVIVWDRGTYRNLTEKRGRSTSVPEAVRSGHLSIWLEGTKLVGGWTLTRSSGYGDGDNWLLIKKSDEHADPDRDVTADEPLSVKTGRDLRDIAADERSDRWTLERATWSRPLLDDTTDRIRCIAVRNGPEVVLWSDDHRNLTGQYPAIIQALEALPVDNFTIDGIVNDEGDYLPRDLLHLLGRDTTVLGAEERRALLAKAIGSGSAPVRSVADVSQG